MRKKSRNLIETETQYLAKLDEKYERRGKRGYFPTDKRVLEKISELREFYNKTNPYLGGQSEDSKDWYASRAIQIAQLIYSETCAWAEDHIAGKVLNYYRQNKAPLRDINSHDHEDFFKRLSDSRWEPSPEALREVFAHIIATRYDFERNTKLAWNLLSSALMAYNEGEIQGLLFCGKTKKRGNKGSKKTLDLLKWMAVCHVYIFRGFGCKRDDAIERVAQEVGFSAENVRLWTKTLPKVFDREKKFLSGVEKTCEAIRAGENPTFVVTIENCATAIFGFAHNPEKYTLINIEQFPELQYALWDGYCKRVYQNFPLPALRNYIQLASLPVGTVKIFWQEDPFNGVDIKAV